MLERRMHGLAEALCQTDADGGPGRRLATAGGNACNTMAAFLDGPGWPRSPREDQVVNRRSWAVNWFEVITGFPEVSYPQTQRRLRVVMGQLASDASTRSFTVG